MSLCIYLKKTLPWISFGPPQKKKLSPQFTSTPSRSGHNAMQIPSSSARRFGRPAPRAADAPSPATLLAAVRRDNSEASPRKWPAQGDCLGDLKVFISWGRGGGLRWWNNGKKLMILVVDHLNRRGILNFDHFEEVFQLTGWWQNEYFIDFFKEQKTWSPHLEHEISCFWLRTAETRNL